MTFSKLVIINTQLKFHITKFSKNFSIQSTLRINVNMISLMPEVPSVTKEHIYL